MPTLLFVHGTGVRRESFDATFTIVRQEAAAELPSLKVAPCFWGEELGARLQHGGKSVPEYEMTRGIDEPDQLAIEAVLWSALIDDPLFELRLLSQLAGQPAVLPPGARTPGERLHDALRRVATGECRIDLPLAGWQDAFTIAVRQLATDRHAADLLRALPAKDAESELALARAIAAAAIRNAVERGLPALDGVSRDALVGALAACVGNAVRAGLIDRLTVPLRGLATRWAARRRGRLTDAALEPSGDVVLYQARGEPMRRFVHDAIARVGGEVFVLAHSLGGIMSVDLLARQVTPAVRGLITLGSQAPYLYEIGALTSLAPSDPLPEHFPPWLNVYDRSDFLSYCAGDVFRSRSIVDFEATSRAPFPESHSAYFSDARVWRRIARFVSDLS
jgi:hypothetical protein